MICLMKYVSQNTDVRIISKAKAAILVIRSEATAARSVQLSHFLVPQMINIVTR